MKVLSVLRGRPGLGHVIPGLSLCLEFQRLGHEARIVSYAQGASFLQASGIEAHSVVPAVAAEHWPGLQPYDDGIQKVGALIDEWEPHLLLLGGEYLLAALGAVYRIPSVMLLNPEILETRPHNRAASVYFAKLFRDVQCMIAIQEPTWNELMPAAQPLKQSLRYYGPLTIDVAPQAQGKPIAVLIANGGGVDFPAAVTGYSENESQPHAWIEQTQRMTEAGATTAARMLRAGERLVVYSSLGRDWNRGLLERVQTINDRVHIEVMEPSLSYYEALANARVVISRAGAGFLHDLGRTSAQAVVWCLTGHAEQVTNGKRAADSRRGTWVCAGPELLASSIEAAIEASRFDVPKLRAISAAPAAVRELLKELELWR